MKYNPFGVVAISALVMVAAFPGQAFAGAGDIYANVNHQGDGTVIRITPAGVRTTFVDDLPVSDGVDFAFDSIGNLFFKDYFTGQIFRIAPNGAADLLASEVRYYNVAVDRSGNALTEEFVSDSGYKITKITPAGVRTTFATGLGRVFDIKVDAVGTVFVADYDNGIVYRYSANGEVRLGYVSGLVHPTAIALDPSGNLFVADSGPNLIYKITPDFQQTTFASTNAYVQNMVCDKDGALFITEFNAGTIAKISPQGVRNTFFQDPFLKGALAIEPPTGFPLNVSARLDVQAGDNAAIGGVIVVGTGPKKLIVRGIGPSLSGAGVAGSLQDPTLELRSSTGELIESNDNWRDSNQAGIQQTGLAPTNDLESAIVVTVDAPSSFTAILRGRNDGVGVGLIEVYDLDPAAAAHVGNLSTRGVVGTGANVLIGGFIVGGGSNGAARVILRALGPSLSDAGVAGALSDPQLSLRDGNGTEIAANDDWRSRSSPQQDEIEASGLAPVSSLESTVIATLSAGNYTAVVDGYNGATGVGLVEIYNVPLP